MEFAPLEKRDLVVVKDGRRFRSLFVPLLEKGCQVEVMVGGTLGQLLIDQLGVDAAYLQQHIQTIFLNAKALDNLDRTVIRAGDVLALSGAMPGLVGATFRKGGKYAVMRREITADNIRPSTGRLKRGKIWLKLFNTVLRDLGPDLLARGIWVSGAELTDRLNCMKPKLGQAAMTIEMAGLNHPLEVITASLQHEGLYPFQLVT